MKLKYYLRGLGMGIVISTLVLTFAFGKESKIELTDEEVIERAEALGMVEKSSGVKIDYNAINQEINGSNVEKEDTKDSVEGDSTVNDSSESISMEHDSLDSANDTDSDEELDEESVDASQENGESESTETEETKESTLNSTSNQGDSETSTDSEESNQTTQENKEPNSTDGEVDINSESSNTKIVTIMPGMTAKEVSEMLEEKGVISDAEDFNLYLMKHMLTESIISKRYELEVNDDYEKLADLLTRK